MGFGGVVGVLAEQRGWTQTDLAREAGLSRQALNRAMRTEMVSPEVAQAVASALDTTPAELRAMRVQVSGLARSEAAPEFGAGGQGASEPAAPGEAGGLGVGGERELWERIGYYRGKQELALENSETSSRLAREASEMLDRAIRALREVHEHTVPVPRGVVRQITPAQEAALADAERAVRLRDAVRAEREQASGARRRGGRAG